MIYRKSKEELAIVKEGGKILASVLWEVCAAAKPGVTELELDILAKRLIVKSGAEPGFTRVQGYTHTLCVSTNDVVVHGVPTVYTLKPGDIIGIDCGVFYKGFNTDMAQTLRVKNQKSPIRQAQGKNQKQDTIDTFLAVGERALEEAIKQAKMGNRVGHISKVIQEIVEGAGYSVVRSLVGHGVGRQLHEEPEVPGFLGASLIGSTPLLTEGMTIAIEVIYNMGKPDVMYKGNDGWTIATTDKSLSGLFERTVAITPEGPLILTA